MASWDAAYMVQGILEMAAGIAMMYVAIVAYAVAPGRIENRTLAIALALEGLAFEFAFGLGRMPVIFNAAGDALLDASTIVAAGVWPFLLAFLLAAVAGVRLPRGTVPVACVLALASMLMGRSWLHAPPGWLPGVIGQRLDILTIGIVSVLGLAGATAKWGMHRGRASAAYLVSFALRDLALALLLAMAFYIPEFTSANQFMAYNIPYQLVKILAIPALAYGILTGRLTNVDRAFRFGVRNGLAASLVAAAFVIVTELAERLLNIDGTVMSLLAAVALAFAFRPVQQMTEALALRLFPGPAA